jgi:gamma-glutamylcyclotransferase (GGCT)/AIG2-like uncharacterized protein YtfP
MLDLGPFPAVVEHQDDDIGVGKIYGEVYLVDEDTLYTLDCIEGHPSFYRRRKVDTPFKKAWTYFLPESYLHDQDNTIVESGLWRPTEDEEEFWRGNV